MTQRSKNEISILIVDDELGMRDFLSYELGAQGYQISTASDGLEALAIVRSKPIDLVISDMKMPRMDGVTALEEIKKINPNIEVIMATGFGTIESAVGAMKKGAYDFIQKPYNVEEIVALVEKAMEKNDLKTLIAIYESSRAVFSTVDLDELLELVMDLVQKSLRADEGSLMFLDDSQKLYVASSKGLDERVAREVHLGLGDRVAGLAAQQRRALLLIGGLEKYPEFQGIKGNDRIGSSIVVPLLFRDELFGILTLNRAKGRDNFNSSDLRLASIFASQVAQAVRNAKLFRVLETKVEELRKAYKTLEETKTELVASEKLAAIGRLVSGVAHEINNPLTSVLGFTEILLSSEGENPMKESLAIVLHEAQRCQKIVQDLLLFTRHKKMSLELTRIDHLADEILEALSLDLKKNSVEVVKNYSDSPPILVDPSQIQQVFLNLIKNAIQAMEAVPQGRKITVSIQLPAPKKMRVAFRDNGPGITAENIDKIFEPFFTTKGVGKGTGLGLSLSYGIIQRHGGCILVDSKPGNGTSFIVEIPMVTEQSPVDRESPDPASEGGPALALTFKGKRILIVEDEEPIRFYLKKLLSYPGCLVETAPDGESALSLLSTEEFDAVLCDCLMPGLDGMKLYEKVLGIKPSAAARFIFVSGCSADEKFEIFLQKHKLSRVTKPFLPQQLLSAIAALFRSATFKNGHGGQ